MFKNKGIATTLIIVIILGVAFIAIGGFILIKNKGTQGNGLLGGGQVGGDCGITIQEYEDYDENDEYTPPDFEQDEARVCMGKSLLKNCTQAHMTLENDGYSSVYKINKVDGECRIRIEYGGDQYLECPVKALTESSMFYSYKDPEKFPGTYMNDVFTTLTLFLGGFDHETGCTTSVMLIEG